MTTNREIDYSLDNGISSRLTTVGWFILFFAIIIFPGHIAGFIRNPQISLSWLQGTSQSRPNSVGGTLFGEAMKFTGLEEGGCQRWTRDNGNLYKGRQGATCWGIVPATAEAAHNRGLRMPSGVSIWGLDEWYQRDEAGFKAWATQVYQQQYFVPLNLPPDTPQIMATIAFDISVNGGVGLGRRFLKQTEGIADGCQRASKMTDLMSKHYESLIAEGYGEPFKVGWRRRVANQRKLHSELCGSK